MIAMLDDSEKKKRRALERSSKRECDYFRFNEEQCLRVNALIKKTKVGYCSGIIQESIYNPRTLFSTVNKLPHKGVPGGRRGGLMVSALDSGASGPGSSPGRGHCVEFLGKTLYSHSASLFPGV